MTGLDEKALAAACEAYGAEATTNPTVARAIRNGVTRALHVYLSTREPAAPVLAGAGMKVAALVWTGTATKTAETPFGNYTIHPTYAKPTRYLWAAPVGTWATADTEEEAKAAAQADFERRILAALEPAPAEAAWPVASIVPPHCTGSSFVFSEGVLHVNKDGSGHIVVSEKNFEIETEYDSEDGSRSDFWITRFPAGEMDALRAFLNGQKLPPAPAGKE